MEQFIEINGQRLLLSEIDDFSASTSFEVSAIDFIKTWRSGTNNFELRTSGSTGKPKVIRITRTQMEASARFTIEALNLQPGHAALVCLDTKYIAGKMMLVRALLSKMNIILKTPSANPFLHLESSPHFAALVPLQLDEIMKNPDTSTALDSLQAVIVGGARINVNLESRVQSIKAPLYATYGMTETVSHIALKRLNGPDKSNRFKAFDEVKLGTDERGCLTIQSVLTNHQRLVTNDRVILHDDHHFEWIGRIDHVINTGGIKIQSEKVEHAIEGVFNDLQLHHRFFVTGMPDDRLGEKVVLVVEAKEPMEQISLVRKMFNDRLDTYQIPKEIIYCSQFKETKTGKIQRKESLNMAQSLGKG